MTTATACVSDALGDTAGLPAVSGFSGLSPRGPGGLDTYLKSIQTFSLLSQEREVELSRRLREEDDLVAAEQLVLSNLRFVVHIARKYQGYGLPLQDIIQEGNIGLMRAVQKFDPSYGVRLISFAAYWIKAEIHEFVMRNWRIVKVSTTRAQRKLFFRLRSMLPGGNRNSLNSAEAKDIAEQLDVGVDDVVEMEMRMKGRDVSLEEARSADDGSIMEPVGLQCSPEDDPEARAEAEDWRSMAMQNIALKMAEFDERTRDIINSRWMTEDKATLETLGQKYSISVERVRQIEKAAILKLRDHLKPMAEQA